MNVGVISSKICDITLELNKIYKKISKIEASNENMTTLLNNEISQRQNLEKHTLTTNEAFSGQIRALKDNYDSFEEVLGSSMDKLKTTISEDVQAKNTHLLEILESTISNQSKQDQNKEIQKIIESNNDAKYNRFEEIIAIEFKQVRSDINSSIVKMEYFDKRMNELYSSLQDQMTNLSKEILTCKSEVESLKAFKRATVQNFQSFQRDFIKNEQINTEFANKISIMMKDLDDKMKNYDDIFINHTNNFEVIKKELYDQITAMSTNLNQKVKGMNESINNQLANQTKEIDHFEHHMLNEHDKFINFIQSHLDEQNLNMKKLFDFSNEDIDILKTKSDSLENALKKLRGDLFKSINESEDFLTKKYESIFRIVNKCS